MKKATINTSELTGAALDYATALATGEVPHVMEYGHAGGTYYVEVDGKTFDDSDTLYGFDPSSSWSDGGPLIYRLEKLDFGPALWYAMPRHGPVLELSGDSPLVATCRAIVAAELGETVTIPEILA